MGVMEFEWCTAQKGCQFLENAAVITEHQSERKYGTLSLRVMLFKRPREKCQEGLDDSDAVLS